MSGEDGERIPEPRTNRHAPASATAPARVPALAQLHCFGLAFYNNITATSGVIFLLQIFLTIQVLVRLIQYHWHVPLWILRLNDCINLPPLLHETLAFGPMHGDLCIE